MESAAQTNSFSGLNFTKLSSLPRTVYKRRQLGCKQQLQTKFTWSTFENIAKFLTAPSSKTSPRKSLQCFCILYLAQDLFYFTDFQNRVTCGYTMPSLHNDAQRACHLKARAPQSFAPHFNGLIRLIEHRFSFANFGRIERLTKQPSKATNRVKLHVPLHNPFSLDELIVKSTFCDFIVQVQLVTKHLQTREIAKVDG